ncbi:hypothetical protein NXS19_005383 [Fusarium pseudograminearum]|nr:hypothetical protein NXS19_005383 [Fusarium pseudograminearum]
MLRSTQDSTEIEYRKNAPGARSPPPVKTNWGQTLQLFGRAYSSRSTHMSMLGTRELHKRWPVTSLPYGLPSIAVL